jgi:putative serine protease PepD
MKRTVIAVVAAAGLLLAACSTRTTDRLAEAELRVFPSPTPTAVVATGEDAVADVVDRVLPAVVNVVTDVGEGTGFVVRQDGIVVTNYHVVEGTRGSIRVLTSEETPQEYQARVIGGDAQADLAVLDVDAEGLPTVPMGDSDQLRLGQPVVAIGYALGLAGGPSVTSGIVSSLTREITVRDPSCQEGCGNGQRVYSSIIQTDAAINPGNSGGPLVDMAGNVIGINTAGTTEAENVGFAIQINSARPTIEQAADNPEAPVAYMGVLGPVSVSDPQVQFQLDPPVDEGVLIQDVSPDGPAARAGIRAGDIVVSFDGEAVATQDDLLEAIRAHTPGDVVDVVIVRGTGERVTVSIELGTNPLPTG